eukprot:6799394-Pyramimonas_sp.AAC.1
MSGLADWSRSPGLGECLGTRKATPPAARLSGMGLWCAWYLAPVELAIWRREILVPRVSWSAMMGGFLERGPNIFRLMPLLRGSECQSARAFQLTMEESAFEAACNHGVQR